MPRVVKQATVLKLAAPVTEAPDDAALLGQIASAIRHGCFARLTP